MTARAALFPLLAIACASARAPAPKPPKGDGTVRTCVVNAKLVGDDALRTLVLAGGAVAGIYDGEVGGCVDRIDAEGAYVLPGFHDAHIHMMSGALALSSADLSTAKSADDIVQTMRRFAEAHPDEPWLIGRGWTFDAVAKPNAKMLATIDPRPIFLESYDGHAAWVNDKALEIAGVEGDGLLLEEAIASFGRPLHGRSSDSWLGRCRASVE